MGATDVVRQDLQLRLAVDLRVAGKHQVLVGLLRVGFLRFLAHDDLAVEHRTGTAAQHPLVQLAAGAVGPGVLDGGAVVHVLRAARHVEAPEQAVGPLTVEKRVDFHPRHAPARGDGKRPVAAVARLTHLDGAQMERPAAFPQQAVVIQLGVVLQDDLRDGVGAIDLVPRPRVGLHQGEPAAGPHHHEGPGVDDTPGRLLRNRGESQVDGPLQHLTRAQPDRAAVLEEGGVERPERVAVVVGVTAEMRFHPGKPAFHGRGQPPDEEAIAVAVRAGVVAVPRERQRVAFPSFRIEGVAAPGNGSARNIRRAQAGLPQRLQARVLPLLVAGGRKAQGAETLHGASPQISGPAAAVAGYARRELLEILEVALLLRCRPGHAPWLRSAETSRCSPAAPSTHE